jgi:hypothetical protein
MTGKMTLLAAIAALTMAAGAARADEFQALIAVSASDLSEQRGTTGSSGCLALGDTVSQNCASMSAIVIMPDGDKTAGASSIVDSMHNNSFTINAVNTGNGAVMQNQLLLSITIQ